MDGLLSLCICCLFLQSAVIGQKCPHGLKDQLIKDFTQLNDPELN